ncbi:MAG: bifunctional 5,10-methylenetetrahydrofolate dehydrogenase/5,10-methenyltetrahydrofolate cyclohydrolase [Bradymonadales bacterium]|jgi:methylenetetrahydrofolate dehydrogenase (NADP+)/methenyltetrahydrofolate cyclohydrolase
MTAIILDGSALSLQMQEKMAKLVSVKFVNSPPPKLAVILVGENPASKSYVRTKERTAKKLGFATEVKHFTEKASMSEILDAIEAFNRDPHCDACFVQLPVPKPLDGLVLTAHVSSQKDADGLTPTSMGRLLLGESGAFLPCTARGIISLLDHYKLELSGKDAVVVGRSNIVGKPVSLLLQRRNCTVTMCHSKTRDLEAHVRRAELLVVATGVAGLIKGEWIREGAIVIDAGFNKLEDGSIVGDVEFNTAKERAAYITPVPGGVGPMTVISLLEQCLESALRRV